MSQPEHTIWVSRQKTLRTQYLHLGVFLWKQKIILASYRLLQVAKFLFMYSFTHTNIVFLFRHLPTTIVILINVCYQIKCFSDDSLFKDIKIFWTVHLRPSITYKGENLDLFWIGCCFQFFIALPRATKSFTFSFISFLS